MILELCRQEAVKLFSQRFIYVLMALVLAVQGGRMIVSALTPPETSLDIVTGVQLWAEGMSLGLRFEAYLLLVLGAMSLSREFSLGTVKTMLVLPIRRWQWATAKLGFLVLFAWSLLLLLTVLALTIVMLTIGLGDVVREEVVLYPAAVVWQNILLSSGLTMVFVLPVCAFALLIGLYFTSSGAAVGVSLLFGIVIEALVGLAGYGKYVFLYHLFRPYQQLQKLGKGLPFQWDDLLAWGLGTTLLTFAVFALWSIVRLERMDITS